MANKSLYGDSYRNISRMADAVREGTYTIGRKKAEADEGQSLMSRKVAAKSQEIADMTPEETAATYMGYFREPFDESTTGAMTEDTGYSQRPRAWNDADDGTHLAGQGLNLREDPDFMSSANTLMEKHGIGESEFFNMIRKESGFNPTAYNKSGATGLFQFMPATAKELGYTTAAIKGMSPSEQVDVYDAYLTRWNYKKGSNNLGMLQGAPGYMNASDDTVVYAAGSKAAKQNPGWRGSDGAVRVRDMKNFYRERS